ASSTAAAATTTTTARLGNNINGDHVGCRVAGGIGGAGRYGVAAESGGAAGRRRGRGAGGCCKRASVNAHFILVRSRRVRGRAGDGERAGGGDDCRAVGGGCYGY